MPPFQTYRQAMACRVLCAGMGWPIEDKDPSCPRYPYVAIDVDPDDADEASAVLFDLGATGVEERDGATLTRGAASKVTLVAAFEARADAVAGAGALPTGWRPRVEEVVGDAWRDEWKKYFEPFRIAGSIVVSPPWRAYRAAAGETVIVLEPGRAFGTGLHETTSLVASVLFERRGELNGASVLDVGCGSGILSFVAAAVGAASVRAIDIDADAVAVTRENAARNALGARVHADAAPVSALTDRYAAVIANIEATTLVELAPDLMRRLAPRGLLMLSGVLAPQVAPEQLAAVRAAFSALREEEVRREGEWVTVVMRA
ncbi:MAG: 50S ribosomal protein L11 methyltransferase [Myxococcota bacterium]|nr:50S ribosomal protein L11 methyltransferase [Myxococcota bacterium]